MGYNCSCSQYAEPSLQVVRMIVVVVPLQMQWCHRKHFSGWKVRRPKAGSRLHLYKTSRTEGVIMQGCCSSLFRSLIFVT